MKNGKKYWFWGQVTGLHLSLSEWPEVNHVIDIGINLFIHKREPLPSSLL